MEKVLNNKKRAFVIMIIFLSIVFFLLLGLNYEKLELISLVLFLIIFLSMMSVSIYYFTKYSKALESAYFSTLSASKWRFRFESSDYLEEHSEILNNLKTMEGDVEKLKEAITKVKNLDEEEFNGNFKVVIQKYNNLLKTISENEAKLAKNTEDINKQVKTLALEVASNDKKTINLRGYKGEVLFLAEKLDMFIKASDKNLSEIKNYTERVFINNYKITELTDASSDTNKILLNINNYIELNKSKLIEISNALIKILDGENKLTFKEKYIGEYLNVKSNLEKVASKSNFIAKSSKLNNRVTTFDNFNDTKNKKTYDNKNADVQNDQEGLFINAMPKTPKMKESFDAIFDSIDYGKYSNISR